MDEVTIKRLLRVSCFPSGSLKNLGTLISPKIWREPFLVIKSSVFFPFPSSASFWDWSYLGVNLQFPHFKVVITCPLIPLDFVRPVTWLVTRFLSSETLFVYPTENCKSLNKVNVKSVPKLKPMDLV